MTYDYIVIGAGSAGCALVNRLSKRPELSILLLEAGGPDDDPGIEIPAAFSTLFKTTFDWAYETTPQEGLNGRVEFLPRGKVFGGSASINAMIYQRGAPANYDTWAKMGNEGWAWEDVLPYFKKLEDHPNGESELHGVGGPVHIADLRDPNPLTLALLEAAREQGFPLNQDFNGETQEGFGLYQVTQKDGMRHSVAASYLHPALERENVTAVTHALVSHLTFEGKQCTGCVYEKDGEQHTVRVTQEVVVCAGAFNSPQLLMLSGIGPQNHLEELGIDVVMDLPGVGQNLQDHMMVPVSYHVTQPVTLAHALDPEQVIKLQMENKGLLTSNIAEAGGFMQLDPQASAPELQFHFGPTWFVNHGFDNPEGDGMTLLPGIVGTKSVGELKLRSANPSDAPIINPNYLKEAEDVQVMVEGVKIARKILNSSAFDDYRGAEYLPGEAVQTDEEIAQFIRNTAQNIYHPVGTCKMGHDAQSVVNEQLQVHGIAGVRIADASIMPFIINANTNIPTIMIGEKCADMILETV